MARPSDIVTVDGEALRVALDGRTQRWLANRLPIKERQVANLLRGGRTRRTVYEAMRAALPALPPPPEPATNGHSNGAGQEVAPGG